MENAEGYALVLEVPGATSEGLEVKPGPLPGTLTVKVAAAKGSDGEGTRIHAERPQARQAFVRTVPVGWDADVERADARVEHGLLRVHVPRRAAEREPAEDDQA